MDRIGGKVGGVAPFLFAGEPRRIAPVQPRDVAPPETALGIVRVAFGVGERVVSAVRCNPIDRTALHRQHAEDRAEVFEGLGEPHAAVGEQPMIA